VVVVFFPGEAASVAYLPELAVFSTARMVMAYLLSLIFAITYGTTAATNKRAAEVMLPVLDILQSVPILGFFPIVLIFFSRTLPDPIGTETAIIVLIFTSMAWNMAFGVYEAITNLPHDLLDASSVFGLKSWQRFRKLQLPATVPKLVYNSILSWTVGWFYLVASEVFSAAGQQFSRPGIGQFIAVAGVHGDIGGILIGIAALATVVVLLDTFLWRPLSVWSERFRMDVAVSGTEGAARPTPSYIRLTWLPRFPGFRRFLASLLHPLVRRWERVASRLDDFYGRHPRTVRTVRRVDVAMFSVILVIVVVTGIAGLVALLRQPLPPAAGLIPLATMTSLGRLVLAYGISLAWTIPAAAWLGRSKWAEKYLTPAIEVIASIPATALFPLLILVAVALASTLAGQSEITALLISLFAMQWYLLFNILAGVKGIPADMNEAAKVFGVRGWTYWKRVLLPAIMPSLLTGSITAWGAGWNALIVAEYIPFGNRLFHTGSGIGVLIDVATYGNQSSSPYFIPGLPEIPAGANGLLLYSILFMIVVVVAMNKLLWRPLIKRASSKYRIEIG
jgi:NitT/TauT family transport system permease protein